MREVKNADEVIQDIAETLAEADGEFIQEIANMVLTAHVEHIEDNLFEVIWNEAEEDNDPDSEMQEEDLE